MAWWTRRTRAGWPVVAEAWPGSEEALTGRTDGERVPITRHDGDGAVIDGTAAVLWGDEVVRVVDFRDLDGRPLELPPNSSFRAQIPLHPQ